MTSLILAGVAVAAFLTAIQTFVQQRNADSLREVYDWVRHYERFWDERLDALGRFLDDDGLASS